MFYDPVRDVCVGYSGDTYSRQEVELSRPSITKGLPPALFEIALVRLRRSRGRFREWKQLGPNVVWPTLGAQRRTCRVEKTS